MSKFFNAFLEFKNEAEGTKRFALVALIIITISLALLSVSGAIALSEGKWGGWLVRGFYACLVFGLESLAAVILVRAILAADKLRAAICGILFVGLAWANVQNAKDGVHFIFPARFAETAQTLNDRAALAEEQAGEIKTAAGVAVASIPDQLATARNDLAKLEEEQKLMSSQTRVREAQHHLQSLGLYRGDLDGIYRELTKEAMLARGEMVRDEMAVLRTKISNLESGAPVSTTATANNQKRVEGIETRAAAREASWNALRLEVILWIAEIARSMGLWAAVTSVSARQTARLRGLEEDIEASELEARLATLRGQKQPEMASEETSDAGEGKSPPETASEGPTGDSPAAEEQTRQQAAGRKGGQSTSHKRQAGKNRPKIPVTDDRAEDKELKVDAG